MSLLIGNSSSQVSKEELGAIPIPRATRSYQPIGHVELADRLLHSAQKYLGNYTLSDTSYALARHGKQMFGVHTYLNASTEMGLCVGFRNSYDRSLAVAIATGATVLVCSNLAFTGEITMFRKHTRFVSRDLDQMINIALLKARPAFKQIIEDAERLKGVGIRNDEAYRWFGLLYGRGILTPRMIPIAKHEWLHPSHSSFASRDAWSLYNAVTEALKKAPPRQVLEKHLRLNKLMASQLRGAA